MSKLSKAWVYSDVTARYPELIAAGLTLAETVHAIVIGEKKGVDLAYACGAQKVYYLGETSGDRVAEDYAPTMAQIIGGEKLSAAVVLGATRRGKAIAAKQGALLDAGVVNDVNDVAVNDGQIKTKHMVYGGLALGEERINSSIAIITLTGGMFEPVTADFCKTGEVIKVDFVEPKARAKCIERQPKESGAVDLARAKRVVGVGRGVVKQEDLELMKALCAAIGAEMGCSRPIAEGEKWMERERYIGVSGVMLKPDIYLAMGISGQIQHMVGVSSTQTIIAVNKD